MKNVLEYLEASARNFPEKTAFADAEESISYTRLHDTARKIGSALAGQLPPRSPVPVLLNKSVRAVQLMLGAAFAGCFYSVIDLRQPSYRIGRILETLESDVIVTDQPAFSQLTGEMEPSQKLLFGKKVLFYEDLVRSEPDDRLLGRIRTGCVDTDLLYVNFTSGSTGTPKGVAICHRSVIDFIDCFTDLFQITKEDVLGGQAPFDFDVSVKDIYSTLRTGACMQIIPQQYFSIPTQLLDFLIDRKVTTLIWAVSALTLVTKLHGFTYRIPERVRKVIFSGEVMPVKHLTAWQEALPTASFYNVYGPTEITCNCTWYDATRCFGADEPIPIGRPFPNEKVFLLDENDQLIEEAGPEGEICVAGTALSPGYYNDPAATAAAFVQNPLQNRYPETVYRTGDLARYLPDGNLVYTGRKDFQIKHMGHRIELSEIELAMNSIPEVSECCCLLLKQKITGFYAGTIDRKQLAALLRTQLPDYMVPNVFVQMPQLPLNKNGKIDRTALAQMR